MLTAQGQLTLATTPLPPHGAALWYTESVAIGYKKPHCIYITPSPALSGSAGLGVVTWGDARAV